MEKGFSKWREKGLMYLLQLFKGDNLKSFEQLKKECDLMTHDFYKYLQIRDYLTKHKEWNYMRKNPNHVEEFLMKTPGNTEKIISKIYKALQVESEDNSLDIKEKWEQESNISIEEEQWEESFRIGHSLFSSVAWREFEWKGKIQYFNVPTKTYKYSQNSDKCWRGCGQTGNYNHIFWDCPVLQYYWDKVKRKRENICKGNLLLDIKELVLGVMPTKERIKNKNLILMLSTIARKNYYSLLA